VSLALFTRPDSDECRTEFDVSSVQTKVSCNEKYYDHDADDVENIHCVLRLRLRDFNMK
jgi:hypothetical protein